MSTKNIIILITLFAVFGAVTSYWIVAKPAVGQEPRKESWTCPMHRQINSDKPGTCPICGMTLVKREDVDTKGQMGSQTVTKDQALPSGHASFHLSFDRQQMIGVKMGVVEKKPLFKTIRAAGRLAFDTELYTVQNEYVEALRFQAKMKDSPLPEALRSAEHMVESSLFRLKVLGLSDEQIARVAQSGKSDPSLLVGKAGAPAWIYAEIYESDLPNVFPGLEAEISGDFLQGQTLTGKVVAVDRVIDPMTRTAKARIQVSKAPANLRPQSYVNVSIRAPLGVQVAVPLDSVFNTGKQRWVFITDMKGHFEPRLVTIRAYAGDRVAIASGLEGGENIVTSANFLIDSESRLKAAAEGSGATGAPKTSPCAENEFWDTSMSMCMPKVGK